MLLKFVLLAHGSVESATLIKRKEKIGLFLDFISAKTFIIRYFARIHIDERKNLHYFWISLIRITQKWNSGGILENTIAATGD